MNGLSPVDVMGVLGPMFVVLPMLAWLLVIGPLVLYPLARWRASRDPHIDPQLGMKVALHYFRSLALQTLLLGAVTLLFTIISHSNDKGSLARAGFGFLVPGTIVFVAHNVLLARTNDAFAPGVRRLFLGYNLVVTGLIGFIAFVVGCQALFAKGTTSDGDRMFLAAILVYIPAWAVLGTQFARLLGMGSTPPAEPPYMAAPPATPQPAPVATPGLPPLGGGSFPPVKPGT